MLFQNISRYYEAHEIYLYCFTNLYIFSVYIELRYFIGMRTEVYMRQNGSRKKLRASHPK